jgi:hypothetical protein
MSSIPRLSKMFFFIAIVLVSQINLAVSNKLSDSAISFNQEKINTEWSVTKEKEIISNLNEDDNLRVLKEINMSFNTLLCKSSICKLTMNLAKPVAGTKDGMRIMQLYKLLLKTSNFKLNSSIHTETEMVLYLQEQ